MHQKQSTSCLKMGFKNVCEDLIPTDELWLETWSKESMLGNTDTDRGHQYTMIQIRQDGRT